MDLRRKIVRRAGQGIVRPIVGTAWAISDLRSFARSLTANAHVRLLRRSKIVFHADVNLLLTALEPAPASPAQRFRLFDFPQSQQRSVKFASRVLASLRSGQFEYGSICTIKGVVPDNQNF